ncbi:MAG: hypothetical protein Q4615_10635 [Paracoccus aminovorans]|nr:hypothetical protein [Paracoccus aminovorans]
MNASIALSFCSGAGGNDTHALVMSDGRDNPHASAGTPYATVTGAEIARMVDDPPSLPKEAGRWFIPSTYAESDARSHARQREAGLFHWLPLDVDENDLTGTEVRDAVASVVGAGVSILIYSSRSATASNKKWRALVPLNAPCPGSTTETPPRPSMTCWRTRRMAS